MEEKGARYSRAVEVINNAFFSLMQEKDFESISVSDIAKRAQINRATFYHHYMDKYDWLEQCISLQLQEIFELCRDVHYDDGTDDQLGKFLCSFRHFEENYSFYSLMLKNKGTLFFQKRFKEIMKELFREKVLLLGSRSMEPDFFINYAASSGIRKMVTDYRSS